MVRKWLTSYFRKKQAELPEASNSNAKERGHALEDLALIYEAREDWEKALETWGQVLVQDAGRIRAMMGRGHALTRLNLAERAQTAYAAAAAFEGDQDIVVENAPEGDDARHKAIWFFRRHRWREAMESWADILERYPLSFEAALHLGQALIELGEIPQARCIYADLVATFSDRAGPWQGLLRIGMYERDWALSDVAYEKCFELGGDSVVVLKQCLGYRVERRQFDAAEDLIRTRFADHDPIEALLGRIKIETMRPNLARALELIAEGEQRFPERGRRFRNKRSDCVARMGRFEDALQILGDNFEGMKAGTAATRRYIRACIEAGRIKKASRMINAVPEEWHWDRSLSSAIAWNFSMQGEPEHARQAWDRVSFRPKLQRHKRTCVRLNRVRWPETVSGEARLRFYSVLCSRLIDIHSFLDYYRNIGVEEFFLIDDGLSEENKTVVLSQSDCVLFESSGHRQDHCFGAYWVNWLKETHPHEGWDLFLGQNAYLTLPDLETLGLPPHLDLMEARGDEVLSAVCLFMYGATPDKAGQAMQLSDLRNQSTAFDARLRVHNSLYCPYSAEIQQYGRSITDPMNVQHISAPLMRSDIAIQYLSGNYLTTPASVSLIRGAVLECRPPISVDRESEDGQILVDQTGFVRYEGPDQLEALGILNRVAI